MKINKLTTEQEGQLVEFREKYRKYGTSCEPMDRDNASQAISEMYKLLGHKPPMFFYCQSPFQAMIEIAIVENWDNLGDNLRANLWANLGANLWDNLRDNLWDNLGANLLGANLWDNLWANLWANLRANLGDNLRANLGDNLGANLWDNLRDNLRANLRDNLGANLGANLGDNLLWDNLWDNLWANLWDNLRANLGDNLGDNLGANLYRSTNLWGQLDLYWIAFYLFPEKHIKKMYSDDKLNVLLLWDRIGKSCGWWWPYENVCFVSDRFETLHQDIKNRLHNPDGPAMIFRDGYAIYAINGVRIPAWIIEEPEQITPQKITDEKNSEVRRVMMQIYGWDKMLGQLNAKLIDEHLDPTIGKLWRWREPDGIDVQIIQVQNGTKNDDGTYDRYTLRVPLEFDNVVEAVKWTYPHCRQMSNERFLQMSKSRT